MHHDDSSKSESIADYSNQPVLSTNDTNNSAYYVDMSVETQQLVSNSNINYYGDITMDCCKETNTTNDGGSYPTIPNLSLTLSSSSYLIYDYQLDFIHKKFEINNSRLLFADEMG